MSNSWYTNKTPNGAFSTIIFSTWQLQVSWCVDCDSTTSLAILDPSQNADHKRPDVSAQRRRFQNLRVCLHYLCLRGILPHSPYSMDEGLCEGSPSTCLINWRCQRSRSLMLADPIWRMCVRALSFTISLNFLFGSSCLRALSFPISSKLYIWNVVVSFAVSSNLSIWNLMCALLFFAVSSNLSGTECVHLLSIAISSPFVLFWAVFGFPNAPYFSCVFGAQMCVPRT